MAGFFARIANLWRGFLSLFVEGIEVNNPGAVYEAAIEERVNKYKTLKKAVSGIIHLRNKLQHEYETAKTQLVDINAQIPVAVESGEDDVALLLIQKKDELEAKLAATETELDKVSTQAEDAKAGLVTFQTEIEKLKREKIEMLAKKENAEARMAIQETLSGLSVEADIKALDNVREHIGKLHAEADISSEISGSSLDARLAKIKNKVGNAQARSQLNAMKAQMAARKAGTAQKTM